LGVISYRKRMAEAPKEDKLVSTPGQIREGLTPVVVSANDVRTIGNEGIQSLDDDGTGVPLLAIITKLLTTADRHYGGESCLEEVKKWFAALWGLLGIMQIRGMLDPQKLSDDVDKIRKQLERRGIAIVLDV